MSPTRGSRILALALGLYAPSLSRAADCNQNGVEDAGEVGRLALLSTPGPRVREVHAGVTLDAVDLDGDGDIDLAGTRYCNEEFTRNCDGICPQVILSFNHDGSSFEHPVDFDRGVLIAAADLTGDGRPELVVGHYDGPHKGFSTLENRGDGSFEAAVEAPGGLAAYGLLVADVDADGAFDLVAPAAVPGSSVAVYRNRGGVLEPPVLSPLEGIGFRSDTNLVPGDVDRDGLVDLVLVGFDCEADCRTSGCVCATILFNVGDGQFEVRSPFAVYPSGTAVTVSDLDDDGTSDLILSSGGTIRVGFTEPGGVWNGFHEYDVGDWGDYRIATAVADLDGDARLDLVGAGPEGIWVLWNRGGRVLESAFGAEGTRLDFVVPIDLGGDGVIDLVGAAGPGISVFANEGDGTFTFVQSYAAAPARGHHHHTYAHKPWTPADLNADGKTDLIGASVLLQRPDGSFAAAESHLLPSVGGFVMAAADLDGDGDDDLAAPYASGGRLLFSVLENYGDRQLQPSWSIEGGDIATPVGDLVASDLDLDGDVDLALLDQIGLLRVFLLDGAASFGAEVPPAVLQLGVGSGLLAADLDADGDDDLMTTSYAISQIIVIRNEGGELLLDAAYPAGSGSFGAGDLDGDGDIDLAVSGAGALVNDGSGVFEPSAAFALDRAVVRGELIVEDLNGDGWADVAGYGPFWQGEILVFRNRSGEGFEEPLAFPALCCRSLSLTAADLDADGDQDLVTNREVLLNDGRGGFGAGIEILPRFCFGTSPAASDFDGDGKLDLAVPLGHFGLAVIWNEKVLDANRNGIPDECERPRFHRGDPNASGTTDISDGISIFGYLFLGNPATLSCLESADSNIDGTIDISDGIYLLSWLFTGGPEPAPPGPTEAPCGLDPDPAGSAGDLRCDVYAPCQ
jgi:hypothetical protein